MHTRPRIPEPVVSTTPYLLMCIDRGRHFTGLYQHVLQNVEDDTQLFQFLRDHVSQHRGIGSWFTFRSVAAISLTRVCLSQISLSLLTISSSKQTTANLLKSIATRKFATKTACAFPHTNGSRATNMIVRHHQPSNQPKFPSSAQTV